jgi:hypothetical protein
MQTVHNTPLDTARRTQSHLQSQWNDGLHLPRYQYNFQFKILSTSHYHLNIGGHQSWTYRQDNNVSTFQHYVMAQTFAMFIAVWIKW